MFKTFVEVRHLREKCAILEKKMYQTENLLEDRTREAVEYRKEKWTMEQERALANRKAALDIEEAKNTIRKDMQKSLIEADLKAAKAIAALETYREMDAKDDRKKITEYLGEAIKGLSKEKVTVNTGK